MMQNVRIQQQYTATLIEQSRLQAFNAEEKLQANDAMGAIELALRGLQRDGDPRPAVPEAEYALSKALQVYTTENQIGDEAFTTGVFVRENKHTGGFFAADGILFARDGNNIYLWNTQTGKLDQKLPVNGTGVQNLSEHLLVDNARQLIYTDGKDAVCYDYAEGTEVWRATGDEPYSDCYALYLPKKDQVVVIWTSLIQSTLAVALVDRTTGREICQDEVKIDGYSMSDSALESSEDGRYIAFFIDTLPGEPLNSAALVYDLEERQTQIFPWKMGAGRTLSFLGDGALAVGMWNKDESWLESENYPGEPWVYKLQTMAQIVCGRVDLESGRWVWQKQFSSGTCDDMQVLVRTVGEQPCVLLLMGNQFLRLDAQSGFVLEEMELEAQFRFQGGCFALGSSVHWPRFGKYETISFGWDWRILCHFANHCFGGPDQKGVLAGAGICRTIRKYVQLTQDGISHHSCFQSLRLLRCKYVSGFNRCWNSDGLCGFVMVHFERIEPQDEINAIYLDDVKRKKPPYKQPFATLVQPCSGSDKIKATALFVGSEAHVGSRYSDRVWSRSSAWLGCQGTIHHRTYLRL